MGDEHDRSGRPSTGSDEPGSGGPGSGGGRADADRAIVAGLLAGAGLDPPDDEVDRLAALYPGLRRSVDRFHAVDVGDGVTAAVFRAELAPPDGRTS